MFELTLVAGGFNFNVRVNKNRQKSLVNVSYCTSTSRLGTNQLSMLAQQIQAVYTLSELRQASRFLDVEFDNLPGDTLFDKAYGLVAHFQNRSMGSHLCAYLATERPHISWQSLFDKLPDSIIPLSASTRETT